MCSLQYRSIYLPGSAHLGPCPPSPKRECICVMHLILASTASPRGLPQKCGSWLLSFQLYRLMGSFCQWRLRVWGNYSM